jgi:hypothetical protein
MKRPNPASKATAKIVPTRDYCWKYFNALTLYYSAGQLHYNFLWGTKRHKNGQKSN